MKRMTYFVMALALVLGFTQCKKEQVNTPENETKTVNITLNVGGNGGGSRHDINTTTGAVDFEDGDVIYVGDGSTYIGTLTRNGGVFSGSINEPNDGTEIYFYFVGGLTPSSTPEAGTTPSFTVDISDQSTKMPVLSCNHVTYHPGTTSYSCKLENQCALVKFTTASTTAPVHVGGLYTGATINFGTETPGITNNGTTGFVALNSKSATEKWAVLLPQTGFVDAEAAIAHVGYTTTIPTIAADGFVTGDAAISISTLSNIVYLDWLTGDYTATDGKILTGRLAGDYKINVNADGATVTLKDATITGTNDEAYSWAGITCENNTTLVIEGANSVTGFYENYPGIFIASGKTLTIEGNGSLDVSSNGGANGWGAGIGSNDVADCGNIVINSGTISATGGIWMAGIGCGYAQNCGYITINGGTVTATGGPGAAGIGLGYTITDITCGDISITGGIVNATGGLGAAGIGSGFVVNNNHNQCGDISITGGQVTATGGDGGDSAYDILKKDSWVDMPYYGGAGIGTGSTVISDAAGYSDCGTITIGSGVTSVTATKGGGTHPATNSIGKNHSSGSGTCGTITIGGTVYYQNNAYVGDGATYLTQNTLVYPTPTPVEQIVDLSTITSAYTAVDGDILTGTLGTGVQISIADGATITLRSANINGSDNLSGTFHGLNCLGDATIILENNDNVVKAKCSSGGRAGIFVPQHKTLTFEAGNSSGFVAATGAGEAAGIGGYCNKNCGAIVINSGKVTGTAGSGKDETMEDSYSAGIGSSAYRRCDGITINGGQVIGTAYADGNAAGIGTGGNGICRKDGDSDGSQPAITISNTLSNYVKAQKGSSATYFIGGGLSSKCGIVIVGGTTYEDGGGNRGISSSTSLSYEFDVLGNSLIYMP